MPAGLAAVVEKMMAKKPEDRYPTPAAVAAALAPWTNKPIAPPAEQEMPNLSPAALAAGNGSGSGSRDGALPPRYPQSRNRPSASRGNRPAPLLAPDRGNSSPDVATTDAMSAQSPTTAEPSRPKVAVTPSRMLDRQSTRSKLGREVEQHMAPPPSPSANWLSWILRAGLILLISGGVGVALSLLTRQP